MVATETHALLEGESPVEYFKTYVVKPHHATDDSQLELKVNDVVYVLEQDHTGWWGGHKEGEDHSGWFPGSCVRPLEPQPRPQVEVQPTGGEDQPVAASSPNKRDMGAVGKGPLATADLDARSPLRQIQLAASPQRKGDHHVPTSEQLVTGGPLSTACPSVASGLLGSAVMVSATDNIAEVENAKLKQENGELSESLRLIKRQSDVDRRNYTEMEAAAQHERELREQIERRFQAELEQKAHFSSEAQQLREQLAREHRKSEAHQRGVEEMQRLYEEKMLEKDDELKKVSEHLDCGRKMAQSEKQRARSLEEQLQQCQEELEALRRDRQAPALAPISTTAAEEACRRLFPCAPGSSSTSTSPRADGMRGLPLADIGTVADSSSTATSHASQPFTAGGALRGITTKRPPEIPIPSGSAARSSSRSGSGPLLGYAHSNSMGDLSCPRFVGGRGPSTPKHEETPPPGSVADRVTMFEQRCQTPRREPSATPKRGPRSLSRDAWPRATPALEPQSLTVQSERALVPISAGGPTPLHATTPLAQSSRQTSRPLPPPPPSCAALEMPEDDDDGHVEQVCFGMSPIERCWSQESAGRGVVAAPSGSNPLQTVPSQATSSAPLLTTGIAASLPLPVNNNFMSMLQSSSHESHVPEVSVLERIRKYEDW
mmetsp:Transcript_70307/g.139350  ORF Transcript_70307/g.139350 Transcript_70307/m.139350 type:complete len:659 (-) Transcript_70307:132-2108(-)